MDIKLKRLHKGAHMPGRATPGSAGLDLKACLDMDGLTLYPMERAVVPTGLAIELPSNDYVALVFARSGLAIREGLAMANGVGVIDSDYRGEVKVPVVNLSDRVLRISNGERIAQLLVMPVEMPGMIVMDDLTETDRGTGGFGSTGTS